MGSRYDAWVGRESRSAAAIDAGAVADLAAVLDVPPPVEGEPLPPLWHWACLHERAPQSQLGADGHPLRGALLPPIEQPRRMFAGARFGFPRPVPVGSRVEQIARVADVTEKVGRSGPLTFVTVRHTLALDGELVLIEDRDLVYSDHGPGGGPAPEPAAVPSATWEDRFDPDPRLLFRFSAVTFNAHRIHYDRAYATAVEGYPGLVVHGPLLALELAELARVHSPGRDLRAFRFRARAAAFDDGAIALRGELDDAGQVARLTAYRPDGVVALEAHAEFDTTQRRHGRSAT